LVLVCSILVACCIAFGGSNWLEPLFPATEEEQSTEEEVQGEFVEQGYYQEIIGTYEAISQSEDADRAENLNLAAEAINGYVIQPGETFSFNDTVGETSAENGYKQAPVLYSSGVGTGDGGGVCQVSTAVYIAAVKAGLEIVERWPHSVPSDYAPIGLDATIVYGEHDLKITNNTEYPVTIYAKAVGQTVTVSFLGKPRTDGITIDATSRVVDRYEETAADGTTQQYYVSEAFRVYYQDGVRQKRDLLSSDIYAVTETSSISLGEGSVDANK
jgi:vancomycin resistance protein YoaR